MALVSVPSALWSAPAPGGGRLIALTCVTADGRGADAVRCRQVLLEHGGPQLLVDHPLGPGRWDELLPDAFGPEDLARREPAHEESREVHVRDGVHVHPTLRRSSGPSATAANCPNDAIDWVIDAYTHGRVADEQMSALLMAIFLRGMTGPRSPAGRRPWSPPVSGWTSPICGATASRWRWWTSIPPAVWGQDHHSVGARRDGGGAVPQAAGRGLGHTGGTLDKLESIPGFTAELTKVDPTTLRSGRGDFRRRWSWRPADRKIYALRDVTGTTIRCR